MVKLKLNGSPISAEFHVNVNKGSVCGKSRVWEIEHDNLQKR